MKTGTDLITEERERQISQEGWTSEHDAEHDGQELVEAAKCYATAANATQYSPKNITYLGYRPGEPAPYDWPWAEEWWKPSSDPVKNLVKAGALIAAEIDRLNHLK